MRRSLFAVFWVFLIALATPRAVAGPVVVELFTSQGCYSCPPADALLTELADQPGVIALSLHVDYWNSLGWKDTFSQPAITARQKAYLGRTDRSHILRYKLRGPFTPEMVVNGRESLVGSQAEMVRERIAAMARLPEAVRVEAVAGGVELAPRGGAVGEADVLYLRLRPQATVAILRGENAGKTLTYANVVRSVERLGSWPGDATAVYPLPEGAGPGVVLVQARGQGAIQGALRLD